VLYHSDNVEASGFLQHLKLPHYVDFQAELNLIRSLRRQSAEAADAAAAKKVEEKMDAANPFSAPPITATQKAA